MGQPASDPTHTATSDAPVEDPTTGATPPQLEYVAPADPPAGDPHPVTPANQDADRPLTRKELEEWYASKNKPEATATAPTASPSASKADSAKPEAAKAPAPAPKAPESSPSETSKSETPKSSAWFKGRPDKPAK